jgi:acid phosphatase family membrane protein YuiD
LDFFRQIAVNDVLWAGFWGWFCTQSCKIVLNFLREKKFNFFWVISTGGMPSSHAGGVCAMAATVGLKEGFSSTIFAFAFIFSFVVMFDAQTSRRSIGKQAEILNTIMDDMYHGKPISDKKILAFVGHTPIQVFVGATIGVLIALLLYPKV